jgi:hypothetical protein
MIAGGRGDAVAGLHADSKRNATQARMIGFFKKV